MSADATNISCRLKIIFASPSDHRRLDGGEPQRLFTDNTQVVPESAATNEAILRIFFHVDQK